MNPTAFLLYLAVTALLIDVLLIVVMPETVSGALLAVGVTGLVMTLAVGALFV